MCTFKDDNIGACLYPSLDFFIHGNNLDKYQPARLGDVKIEYILISNTILSLNPYLNTSSYLSFWCYLLVK